MKRALLMIFTLALCGSTAFAASADVIVVVDESGSMGGEHAWIDDMISALDTGLANVGVTGRYGLVGFGGGSTHLLGHTHTVGGGEFGTAAQFATAAGTLLTNGSTEDGWDGIHDALGYSFDSGAAVNIILVTDEDRDTANGAWTYANTLAALVGKGALLNAVINGTFNPLTPLGVDSDGNAYYADGSGGFTSTGGGTFASGSGTTGVDYVDLAWDTGGAAWDLNLLRAGGLTAQSFTAAFVDIKVQEIQEQVEGLVPLPGALPMGAGLLALLGLGGAIRRRRRVA